MLLKSTFLPKNLSKSNKRNSKSTEHSKKPNNISSKFYYPSYQKRSFFNFSFNFHNGFMVKEQFILANKYFKQEKYLEAIEGYKGVIYLSPNDGGAYFNLGCAYKELNEFSEAISSFKMALKKNKTYEGESYFKIGCCYYDLEQLDLAKKYFSLCVSMSENVSALTNLARIHHSLKEYSDAIKTYQATLKLQPDNFINRYYLAQIYFRVGHYEDALTTINTSLEYNPNVVNSVYLKAKILEKLGNKQESESAYSKWMIMSFDVNSEEIVDIESESVNQNSTSKTCFKNL